jgi:hypothetical protein
VSKPITFAAALSRTWDGIRLQGTAVLDHVTLINSAKDGIVVDGGAVTVTCSTIAGSLGRGIAVTPNGVPALLIRHSNLTGNGVADLANYHIGISPVPAALNWWGDRNGPGSAVIGSVSVKPWLRETAVCPVPDYVYYLYLPVVPTSNQSRLE